MAHFPKDNTALLVIDIQKAFLQPPIVDMERSTPEFEDNVKQILAAFRHAKLPVVHVHHQAPQEKGTSFDPNFNPTGVEPQDFVKPVDGEHVVIKNVNSAFIGTNLEALLRDNKWTTLVVVGLTTSQCVSSTVRMAGNLGFQVYVAFDATAAYEGHTAPGSKLQTLNFDAETIHEVTLGVLHGEFATVLESQDILKAVAAL